MSLPRPASKASVRTLDSIRRDPLQAPSPDPDASHDIGSAAVATDTPADEGTQIPPFKSFFTLVEDTSTSTTQHHHPSVHYIFSDDDTHIIAEAALRALEDGAAVEEGTRGSSQSSEKQGQRNNKADTSSSSSPDQEEEDQKQHFLPPPQPGVTEHYLILDVDVNVRNPTTTTAIPSDDHHSPSPIPPLQPSATTSTSSLGRTHPPTANPNQTPVYTYTISSAQSLSPTWQVLSTQLTHAPTMDDTGTTTTTDDTQGPAITVTSGQPYQQQQGRGTMLKIEGIGMDTFSLDSGKNGGLKGLGKGKGKAVSGTTTTRAGEESGTGAAAGDGLTEMARLFESRMKELGRVVEAARERDVLGQGEDTATDVQ